MTEALSPTQPEPGEAFLADESVGPTPKRIEVLTDQAGFPSAEAREMVEGREPSDTETAVSGVPTQGKISQKRPVHSHRETRYSDIGDPGSEKLAELDAAREAAQQGATEVISYDIPGKEVSIAAITRMRAAYEARAILDKAGNDTRTGTALMVARSTKPKSPV